MEVLRDGTFSFTIETTALARGLRPSKRTPRNAKFLVEALGAVGLDGVLQVIDDLEPDRVDTSIEITDAFPYPQIFVFNRVTIVCGETDIYEWDGVSLTLVIGPVTAGELWSAVEFFDFIYMTNGVVSILRDPFTGEYALTADQPVGTALANFNGQVFVGSPEE